MPAYEYQCKGCGCHFERRQKMSDPELDSCPECGGAVKRLISGGAGAITKGGGQAASDSAGHACCGMGEACGGMNGGGCCGGEFCQN